MTIESQNPRLFGRIEQSVEEIDLHGDPAVRVRYTNGAVDVFVTGCDYCDRERAAGSTFFPHHHASSRCRSDGRSHCMCDTCF